MLTSKTTQQLPFHISILDAKNRVLAIQIEKALAQKSKSGLSWIIRDMSKRSKIIQFHFNVQNRYCLEDNQRSLR